MGSQDAMNEVLRQAQALSSAKSIYQRYPTETNERYLVVRRELYEDAVKKYTDPFGTKGYAQ